MATIQKGIERNLEVLESIGGLFAASAVVERQEFQAFVNGPLSRHQEIQALSWNQRVKDSDRASYEAATPNDGSPSFQITERKAQGQMERAERRAEYIAVAYIEPLKGNEAAVGFDVASNPTRLKALERSRDAGEMVATARITLVQETKEQFGILILKPVYKTPHETVEQRRQNLTGFAVGVFRVGDMVEAAVNTLPEEIVNIQLVDEGSAEGERLLYLRQASPGDGPTDEDELEVRDKLFLRASLEMPGRQWSVLISPTPEFSDAQASWESWGVLAGGLIITALLVSYLINMIHHAANIERLAAKLAESNEDLEREITERTLAVEALTYQARLLANVNDAVISSNERFVTTAWNRAAEEMYGWKAEEIIGRPTAEVLKPEFVDVEPDEVFRRLLEEGSFEGEVIHPRKDGTRIHTEVRAIALRDKDGRLTGFVSIDRDITERKRAEKALREANESLRRSGHQNAVLAEIGRIISSSFHMDEVYQRFGEQVRELIPYDWIVISSVDPAQEDVRVEYVYEIREEAATAQPGYSRPLAGSIVEEVLRRGTGMLSVPRDRDELVREFPAGVPSFDLGKASLMSVPLVARGKGIGMLAISSTIRQAYTEEDLRLAERVGAQISGAIANARLYSERTNAVEALRESEERFRSLFEDSAVGMTLADRNGQLTQVNQAMCRILGYDEPELTSKSVSDITFQADRKESNSLLRQLWDGERDGFAVEKRFLHKDGRLVWGAMSVSAVRDGEGNTVCALGQVQDITERKMLQEQLLQSQKMEAVGQLAGGVAHDFNNLLTAILGYASLARGDLDPGDPARDHLDQIQSAGQRAATITRQLLAFSRRVTSEPIVVGLNDCI